jgi:single-strand DNA-binding protein
MNVVSLVGCLGSDIEMFYTSAGFAIGEVSLALREKVKDGEGYTVRTDWINIKLLGTRAEAAAKYTRKGSKVAISGKIQEDKWIDKNTKKSRSKHVILVDRIEFVDSRYPEEVQKMIEKENAKKTLAMEQKNSAQQETAAF